MKLYSNQAKHVRRLMIFSFLALCILLSTKGYQLSAAATAQQDEWKVEVEEGKTYRSHIKVDNNCSSPHLFRIKSKFEHLRFEQPIDSVLIGPGSAVKLEALFDAKGLRSDVYRGKVIVGCIDCKKEMACTIDQKEVPVAMTVTASSLYITLERTLCLGTCPNYKLSVSADGNVIFDGRYFVTRIGTATSKISEEKVQKLKDEFESINYYSLKDEYTKLGVECPEYEPCSSRAVTSIRINGKSKSVNHSNGCMGTETLKALTRLESRIDEIVNTKQWVK